MVIGIILGIILGLLIAAFVVWNKKKTEEGKGIRNFFYWIWRKIQPVFCPHPDCELVYADEHSTVFRCKTCGKEFVLSSKDESPMPEQLLKAGYEWYYPGAFSNKQNELYVKNTRPPFAYNPVSK